MKRQGIVRSRHPDDAGVNNWDILGERGTTVFSTHRRRRPLHRVGPRRHVRQDGRIPRTTERNGPSPTSKEEFIEKVDDDMLDLDYEGYGGINKVPLDHARWFSEH